MMCFSVFVPLGLSLVQLFVSWCLYIGQVWDILAGSKQAMCVSWCLYTGQATIIRYLGRQQAGNVCIMVFVYWAGHNYKIS